MSCPTCAASCTPRCAGRGGSSNTFRRRATYKEWPARKVHFGYYIPDAEPRFIPDGAIIHESVMLRMEAMPSYRPVNLPKQYEKFPMPEAPVHASAQETEEEAAG